MVRLASHVLCRTAPRSASCFFSKWYGAHRDLHSFPTRRSSDLLQRVARASGGAVVSPASLGSVVERLRRSEEHTSELQSHSDLVCRLLLEKKKKNQRLLRSRARQPRQPRREPTHLQERAEELPR